MKEKEVALDERAHYHQNLMQEALAKLESIKFQKSLIWWGELPWIEFVVGNVFFFIVYYVIHANSIKKIGC